MNRALRRFAAIALSVSACLTSASLVRADEIQETKEQRDARMGWWRDARFGMTELNVGSAAIMGSAFLLPLIGEAAMRRLVLLSDFIDAEEARRMNLVHEVWDAGAADARIREIALGLAGRAALGVALTKEWWRLLGDDVFNAAMAHARQAHAKNFASGGFSAGSARFVAREKH